MKCNMAVVDLLRTMGKRKHTAAAQMALAWLLAQKPWIVPIPGFDKTKYLDENVGAIEIELTSDDLREIEEAYSKIPVQGNRLSDAHMALIDR